MDKSLVLERIRFWRQTPGAVSSRCRSVIHDGLLHPGGGRNAGGSRAESPSTSPSSREHANAGRSIAYNSSRYANLLDNYA